MTDDNLDLVHSMGHRKFVGGGDEYWKSIGTLQFETMKRFGLEPNHTFVDVACGSLRGGVHYIPYLNQGCYLGLDQHIDLIIVGVCEELGVSLFREKRPQFVISKHFEFEKFERRANWGLAQSLFSHLCLEDIRICLAKLRGIAAPEMRFFATFNEADMRVENPSASHSHAHFRYTSAEIESCGADAGWSFTYIGAWGHPRGQMLVEFNLA